MLLARQHVEMSINESARGNGHATVVVRATIKHVSSSIVRDADERIIRCGLLIVPVSNSLREAVEAMAGDAVRPSGLDPGRGSLDGWRPGRIVCSRRIKGRNEEKVGE